MTAHPYDSALRRAPDRFSSPDASATDCDATSVHGILDEVCREIHDRFDTDVDIVLDHEPSVHVEHRAQVRAIFDQLLWGLLDACHCLRAGRLGVHVRTRRASNRVLTSIDVLPDACADEYRARVMALLVEQRDDPVLGHDLDAASVAIRNAGGTLLCREGDDGRLWIQVGLPVCS